MSYLTTNPEALDFAAGKLDGIGTALAAQNAASAASTATVAPAAADEVSALQATQFSAYGNLYQQVSAEATAIHQAFVQMLGTSAGSYGATEAANSASTGTGGLGGLDLTGQLTQYGQFGLLPGMLTNSGFGMLAGGQNFGGAASNFIPLSKLSTPAEPFVLADAGRAASSAELAAVPAGGGTAPVLASMSQAPAVGRMSVPPSWAGATPAAASTPSTLTAAEGTATPHNSQFSAVPAGLPSTAANGRTSTLGVQRYGMKPKVMPKPSIS